MTRRCSRAGRRKLFLCVLIKSGFRGRRRLGRKLPDKSKKPNLWLQLTLTQSHGYHNPSR